MVDPDAPRRPIRFALQVNPAPGEIDRVGAEAEAAGFDVLTVADHIGDRLGAPMVTLARLAGVTESIHLGTMVLNNDMRNPVQLAWEAATLHRLSGGRFELGLGAGHTPHEYAATGIAFDRPAVRKRRLAESVEIIAALLAGETVTHDGHHHTIDGAVIGVDQPPPPILVGGNGTALLRHAAANADAIGLQGLGRTREDGHRHEARFGIDHLEAQLALIADAVAEAGRAGDPPELNALVQVCTITDDREAAIGEVLDTIDGLDPGDARRTPYLAVGTVEQIARQFLAARDDWGISYFTVREPALAPVIAEVRRLDGR